MVYHIYSHSRFGFFIPKIGNMILNVSLHLPLDVHLSTCLEQTETVNILSLTYTY